MATEKTTETRVQLVADKGTRGARVGAKATPLSKDLKEWLDKGWKKADDTSKVKG
jgi:membrane protease subunit (stomatin/prohibitin family)